jgi:hypothetical protein
VTNCSNYFFLFYDQEKNEDIKPEITTSLFDTIPLQHTPTPVLPRNFFVTGYSPETLDLESSVSPASQPAVSDASLLRKAVGLSENYFTSVENVGPSVAPRIARITREVARMHSHKNETQYRRRTVPGVAATQPPGMDDEYIHHTDYKWPPQANQSPSTEEPRPTGFKWPPQANPQPSTGLPPKGPTINKSAMNKQGKT